MILSPAFSVTSFVSLKVYLYCPEALSVIIQVISFKTRGVRVFKMSPIHHHFELSGWAEQTVVNRFWFGGAVLAIIGVLLATITL